MSTQVDAHGWAVGPCSDGHYHPASPGTLRIAVKDNIDVGGVPTTAGSAAYVAWRPGPAGADAACLAGIRTAEAKGRVALVGKARLHELACGSTGINPWSGTPANPLAAALIPGGSSSGSAVAVAMGDADIALGTDTGGSIRIPAACCGVAGLKTTHGRIPVGGSWPLAPSLDSIGPLARTIDGLVAAMALLEPGFGLDGVSVPNRIARLRGLPVAVDPLVDAAVDDALARLSAAAGIDVVDLVIPTWMEAWHLSEIVLATEAYLVNRHLLDSGLVGDDTANRLGAGADVAGRAFAEARRFARIWPSTLADALAAVGASALVCPTLTGFPPPLSDPGALVLTTCTRPVNLAGWPALALPIQADGPLPASLQIATPVGADEHALAIGLLVERAIHPDAT